MRRFEVRIDVTDAVGTGERLSTAATVTLPDDARSLDDLIVLVGYPGGGYSRGYFDLHPPGHDGYSEAEFHAADGMCFVACDHLGVGDADVPEVPVDYDSLARADAATARGALSRLRDELAGAGSPGTGTSVIGIGHSQGGFLLSLLQANWPTFDAVAFLGWSGVQTVSPWPPGTNPGSSPVGEDRRGLAHPLRAAFYRDDVPGDIVEADLTRYPGEYGSRAPWGSVRGPGGQAVVANRQRTGKGVTAAEAALIAVPVFVGVGDVDLVAEPMLEPSIYSASPHVTTTVVADMAHMHNFAGSRRVMWQRLALWARAVRAMQIGAPAA